MSRSYQQACGLARALDVLGERWTMLVIRELALGPRRYGDLVAALTGIGTNLLADRLKRLEEHGVVERMLLPAPASVPAYALTDAGLALRPVLDSLTTWGFAHVPVPDGAEGRASWVVFAMTAARPGGPQPADALVELSIDEELFWVRSAAGQTNAALGPSPLPPELRMRTDLATFAELACGRMSPAAAIRAGSLDVDGPRATATAFFKAFRISS
jgi:DNA-binding HxlR family transcriptional regulator